MYEVNAFEFQTLMSRMLLLAQGDAAPNAGPPANPLLQMAPMLAMFVVLFYLIVLRPQQREQQQRRDMLSGLKKNDKVVTIGGIIGTIVEFSGDGSRVTLKVDDGTRIKFTRSSLQGPYDEKSESENSGNS